MEKAKAAGVEILGDVELFARTVNAAPVHKRPKIIAITGTNGKSTTTALIGHLCASAGRDTRIGGNIGLGVLGLQEGGLPPPVAPAAPTSLPSQLSRPRKSTKTPWPLANVKFSSSRRN